MQKFLESLSDDKFITLTFTKGEEILDYFRENKTIGLIEQGEAKVYYHTIDNKALFLNVLKKGSILGLSSAVENDTTTKVVAKTELKVKALKKEVLKELFNDVDFNRHYILALNNKINFLLKKIRFLSTADIKLKVLSFLMEYEVDGVVNLPMYKVDLIYYLNVSKASLFNELARLREEGLIDYKNKTIVIKEKEKIESLMEEYK